MVGFRDPDDNLVVQFRFMPIENKLRTLEEGRPIFDDVEMCEIRAPGSKDVKYFPATVLSTQWLQDPITGEQKQITYAERFPRQYQQFKARSAQTVTGTPLEYAQFLTEGKRAELRALNVYTIETLANIEGNELKNLGTGGRDLKNKAIKYIEDAKASAGDKQMVIEIAALKAKNQVLEDDLKAAREIATGARVATAESDFEGMNDQQLVAYVTHHTGREPHGTLPRKTLLRMAAEATPIKAA